MRKKTHKNVKIRQRATEQPMGHQRNQRRNQKIPRGQMKTEI